MTKRILFLLAFGLILFSSCKKDKPNSPSELPPIDGQPLDWGVYVVNEGSLGTGSASLSFISGAYDTVYNYLYQGANGQPLGDVFQSILGWDNLLFLAINNSDVIRTVRKSDYKLVANIPIHKPRYFLPIDSDKIYVSTLFYPEINILNPRTLQIIGTITTDYPNTEGMCLENGMAYVCNWDTACNYIYEINPNTDQIVRRITIAGYAPQQVLADKDGKLWVLAGNVENGKAATITRLDPVSGNILQSYNFGNQSDLMKPAFNPTKDTLYFLGVNYNGGTAQNGVFRMAINAASIPTQPLIQAQSLQYFWALGIEPGSGHIWVGDPKGFIQRGDVFVYNQSGELLKTFKVENGPGYFWFD